MSKLVKIDPKEFGLEENKAAEIAAQFQPMLDKMVELEKEYNEIIAKPIDEETVKLAKALRQKYVKVRTGTAEIHKVQKAFYLSGGRFVDGWKNAQLFASQGIEEKLEAIEKHHENLERERINALRAEREAIAIQFGVDVNTVALGLMSEEVWKNFIAGAEQSYKIRIEAEQKAEEERIERERKEKVFRDRQMEIAQYSQFLEEGEGITIESTDEECSVLFHQLVQRKHVYDIEQENIRKENERLKKEAEEKEAALKAEREEAEAKQRETEEAARIEREAIEAKAKAEREEAQRIADEKLAKEKAESDRLAKELADKKAAEEKAERDRIAAEKKAKAAPDKQKLIALSETIKAIQLPEVKSDEAQQIVTDTEALILKLVNFITSKAEQL